VKYAPAVCIAIAFVVGVLVLRTGSAIFGVIMLAVALAFFAFFAWNNRAKIRVMWARKVTEWQSDVKQLRLWLKLAFTRNRDARATATMAHQQQFLQGRIADPVNMIMIAAVAVIALPLVGGFQEWRIGRVKAERDAPCNDRELSRDSDGEFRTSREACASLGATAEVASEWRTRAIEAEAARIRDVARIRMENDLATRAEQARRVRSEASQTRQRRRQDEAIASAIGGPAPDLERSLCELAGGSDCGATGSGSADPAPVAGDLSSGAAGDTGGDSADTPAGAASPNG